ncbi:MAG TPA: YifB family Mg chelatase-like AAA ATPase [Solirubrobacterales bacterium]|nr:YifB family Mg chelatase-like AAA ATPase [Solirubrobacterales bacterium]
MLATAHTFTLDGISARPVRVEVDVHRGLPGFAIVGLPDAAVREARERVRAALVNCGFEFPLSRIVVNLAPASLRKAGPGMDLAIAAALLRASGQLEWEEMDRVALAGELALDGQVRSIYGALAIAEAAREDGAEAIVVPADNGPEAALAAGIEVWPLASLAELPALAAGERVPEPSPLRFRSGPAPGTPDLADLRGQPHLRHALEVAAAGGHSLLMVGPPGAGKSLAASRLPSILPPLGDAEALEVARIASATGRLGAGLPAGRPFRAPHHTTSAAGLIGGGTPPRPGEITLAHRGVLFLDELCEFHRNVLEALRAPLEAGEVAIARVGGRRRLPCRFMLVAASNPCPCGRGEDDPDCTCFGAAVQRYQGKLSGALADRIDLLAAVSQPSAAEIGGAPGESSAAVRERVCAARERQEARLGSGRCNAEMSAAEVRECELAPGAAALLADLYARRRLSGRAHDRALRLAQTVADLASAPRIGEEEMAQALQLRRRDRV